MLAYSPLASGILTGKYRGEKVPEKARLNLFPGFMKRYRYSLNEEAANAYGDIANEVRLTPLSSFFPISIAFFSCGFTIFTPCVCLLCSNIKAGMTPSELALSWCYHRRHVSSTIIGATTLEQLHEDIKAYDIKLDDGVLDKVSKVYKKYTDPTKAYGV